jgi:soluble lytic murein transglycosylase-like protein
MRIDMDLQPIGREQMMQRLQEMQAKAPSAPVFQLPDGKPGLSGNLPEIHGLAPFDPTGMGVSLKADQAPSNLKALIEKAAGENSVDPALLDAVVACESSYDPMCRSRAGALGLTQLMPDTMKEMGVSDWKDPEQNLQGGARYLSKMLAKYPGRTDLALAAYNAGPGAVAKHGGIPPYTETKNYVNKVLGLYNAKRSQP